MFKDYWQLPSYNINLITSYSKTYMFHTYVCWLYHIQRKHEQHIDKNCLHCWSENQQFHLSGFIYVQHNVLWYFQNIFHLSIIGQELTKTKLTVSLCLMNASHLNKHTGNYDNLVGFPFDIQQRNLEWRQITWKANIKAMWRIQLCEKKK